MKNHIGSILNYEQLESMRNKRPKVKKIPVIYSVGDILKIKLRGLYDASLEPSGNKHIPRPYYQFYNKFKDIFHMHGLDYSVSIEVIRLVTIEKITTYYGKYLDIDVAFDNSFYKISKLDEY